jgi:hypothetical protein
LTVFAQAALFLASYAPLFGVFALLDTFGKGLPTLICGALAILGAALPALVFGIARSVRSQPLHIATARSRDGDVLAYVASYLVPFAAMAANTDRQRAALALFVVLVAVLYIRAELFYVNPLMALAGYRLFDVDTKGGQPAVLPAVGALSSGIAPSRLGD